MRSASIIVAAVMTLAAASSAVAFPGVTIQPCDELPPLNARQPVVGPVWVYDVPADQMTAKCNKMPGAIMAGCTFLATDKHPAVILLNALLTPHERACTLLYEKAHLPPNSWLDPMIEARAVDMPGITPPAELPGMVHAGE